MLLVGEVLDVVPYHFSPVIDLAGGAPHVLCPEGEQLEATSNNPIVTGMVT